MDDKIRDPSSTTAAAVSSHDDSIPNTLILLPCPNVLPFYVVGRGMFLNPQAGLAQFTLVTERTARDTLR